MSTAKMFIARRKRKEQIKKKIIISFLTLGLIMFCIFFFGDFSASAESENHETLYKYYTQIEIEYGDTLWEIAQANMGDQYSSESQYIEEVMHINHLDDENICSGTRIVIPYYSIEFE